MSKSKWKKPLLSLSVLLLLTGCGATRGLEKITDKGPVCTALGDPIKYNPYKLNSPRHAGPVLAQDLAGRNQVGVNLTCPAYNRD